MTNRVSKTKQLLQEIDALKNRIAEYEDTLGAIRAGVVDAVVVSDEQGERIFSLQSVDYSYRVMVENMNEGAVTLDKNSVIVFTNRAFSAFAGREMTSIVGARFSEFLSSALHDRFLSFLQECTVRPCREEFSISRKHGGAVPVSISGTIFKTEASENVCLIISDVHERKEAEHKLRSAYEEVEKKVQERTTELRYSKERT